MSKGSPRRGALGALGLVCVLASGCDDAPCARDVAGCQDDEGFSFDASCETQSPLTVQLLELHTGAPVPEGRWPQVHHGIQGGVHFELAVVARGLEPDFMNVQLNLDAADCSAPDCTAMDDLATRTLDTDGSMWELDGDTAILYDVVLILDHEPSEAGELTIDAVDPCGRVAQYVHSAG